MQEEEKKRNILNIVAGIVIGSLFILALFRIFSPDTTTISGTVQYNGLKPEDPTKGKVVVEQRELGQTDYAKATEDVLLKDGASWSWDGAEEGKTYQIRAYILYKDNRIADSSVVTVTAPAQDQILTFNVTQDDLPEAAKEGTSATISGTLDLNGYVPDGSTVTVYGKERDAQEFVALGSGPAVDGRKLSWSAAKAGVYYTFQGELYDPAGNLIGESEYTTIAAPATNQVIRIDSQAEALTETSSISGIVKINGPIQANSTLLMLQRKPGDKDFKAFDRIPAANNAHWEFTEAQTGQDYEITSTLQVNNQDTSVGTNIQVTAPATDEVITINTNYSLTPPTQTPTASCTGQQSGSEWNISVKFPSIENAAQYYLQSGTTQGGNDLLSERTAATGGDITRNIIAADQEQVYTRYAYTYDSSCNDKGCFSSFSPMLVHKCPQ